MTPAPTPKPLPHAVDVALGALAGPAGWAGLYGYDHARELFWAEAIPGSVRHYGTTVNNAARRAFLHSTAGTGGVPALLVSADSPDCPLPVLAVMGAPGAAPTLYNPRTGDPLGPMVAAPPNGGPQYLLPDVPAVVAALAQQAAERSELLRSQLQALVAAYPLQERPQNETP